MFEFLSLKEPLALEPFDMENFECNVNTARTKPTDKSQSADYIFLSLEEPRLPEPFDIENTLDALQSYRFNFLNEFRRFGEPRLTKCFMNMELVSLISASNIDASIQSSSRCSAAMTEDTRPFARRHSCFLDLPVEIRLLIYEYLVPSRDYCKYKASGSKNPVAPRPPPITRVCRLIRKETLEHWYPVTRFPILFRLTSWFDNRNGVAGTQTMMRHVPPKYIYICSISPIIQRLELCVDGCEQPWLRIPKEYLCFNIDLNRQANSYNIYHRPRIDGEDLEEYLMNLYRFNTIHRDRQAHDRRHRRVQITIKLLLNRFDQAMSKIMSSSGGIGHITFEHDKWLTPLPSWRFWADMVENYCSEN